MARVVTVQSIMQQARQRVDAALSNDPPDSDLLAMLNQAFPRYYDLLVEAYGQDYFFSSVNIVTVGGQADYALASLIPDFYKLRFIDLQWSLNGAKVPIEPYNEALRDAYSFGSAQYVPGGATLTVSYTPTCPTLAQYASLAVTAPDGVNQLVFTASQPGTWGLGVSVQIVPGSGALSVTNNGLAVTVTLASGGSTGSAIVAAVNAAVATILTASDPYGAETFTAAQAATNLSGTVSYDFINGWERLLIVDCALQIMQRVERDGSILVAELNKLIADVRALSATRDSGACVELKDYEAERTLWPWAPPFLRGFTYRLQGGNLHLLPMLAGQGVA